MDKDLVAIGPRSALNALSGVVLKLSEPVISDFEGDAMILPARKLAEGYAPRRTGVAKARRVARNKRAKKLARRR